MSFTAIDGYAIVADLRCGSNGALSGAPEVALGSCPDDEATARFDWDRNLADGFDSGWVSVGLEVCLSGDTTSIVWTVGDVQMTFAAPGYDDILGFVFRSGVCAPNSTASFRNVTGQFFASTSESAPDQTVYVDDASATTVGADEPEGEAIVTVAPEGAGFRRAKLFAEVRIQGATLPDPCDLFTQAFIYTT